MTLTQTIRPVVARALPEVIYIETSNACNSLCETCPLTFFGNGAAHNLTLDEFDRITGQVPDLKRAVLHGLGEPLLNRDLAQMIRRLKARDVHALFNSNIIALTRKKQEELVESGLDELRVSLDAAIPETYRKIRGVPAHAKVVKHLREMVEIRERMGSATPKISVWFTAMKENLPELADAVAQPPSSATSGGWPSRRTRSPAALWTRHAHSRACAYVPAPVGIASTS